MWSSSPGDDPFILKRHSRWSISVFGFSPASESNYNKYMKSITVNPEWWCHSLTNHLYKYLLPHFSFRNVKRMQKKKVIDQCWKVISVVTMISWAILTSHKYLCIIYVGASWRAGNAPGGAFEHAACSTAPPLSTLPQQMVSPVTSDPCGGAQRAQPR